MTDISTSILKEETIARVLDELQTTFISLAENKDLSSVVWTSVDPEGFDPDVPKGEYHDAPDYAGISLGKVQYEVHGIDEAQTFLKKITLVFTEWAIQAAVTINTKAQYQNSISHPVTNRSSYAERMEKIKHSISTPERYYTGKTPGKRIATETAPSSETSYFSI